MGYRIFFIYIFFISIVTGMIRSAAKLKSTSGGLLPYLKMLTSKLSYLIPSSFVAIYQNENGDDVIEQGLENCYYTGHLGNIELTSVTMETCAGVKGLLKDEDGEEYFVEPHVEYANQTSHFNGKHIFYNMKSIRNNKDVKVCGNDHSHDSNSTHWHEQKMLSDLQNKHSRKRRSANEVKYIEVIAVMDRESVKIAGNVTNTIKRAVSIFNYVDGLYKTMNTRVVLAGVVVWNVYNMIKVSPVAGETLADFRTYTRYVLNGKLQLYPDNAQFITKTDFEGSLIGLAGVGVMCSVTSCAVNQDHKDNPALSANTVTHEMGHNIGFYHNGNRAGCECPQGKTCVMGAYVAASPANSFTPCQETSYADRLGGGELPCLMDFPSNIYGEPKCGDGFIEGKEECDCGSQQDCIKSGLDKCCNSTTCKLMPNARCSSGLCCENCQFKAQGVICRPKFNVECDLPEYCTGTESECPKNYYAKDGSSCENGAAFCYEGACRSHSAQCQIIWGPNATRGDDICFDVNTGVNDVWGNCGRDLRGDIISCDESNKFCGKVQCAEKPGQPVGFPLLGGAKKYSYPSGKTCLQARFDVSSDQSDPGLALDGTKCSDIGEKGTSQDVDVENQVCIESKCTNMSQLGFLKACPQKCKNGGVCNNNGHCHCPPGYACPDCTYAGPGGSFDSGQGCVIKIGGTDRKRYFTKRGHQKSECFTPLVQAMLVLFLLVVPLILFIVYICYFHQDKLPARCRILKRRDPAGKRLNTQNRNASFDNEFDSPSKIDFVPQRSTPPRPTPPSAQRPTPPPQRPTPPAQRPTPPQQRPEIPAKPGRRPPPAVPYR